MKLACVESNGLVRVAVVAGDEPIDLTAYLGIQAHQLFQFLAMGSEASALITKCTNSTAPRLAKDSVKFRAPVMSDKVLGVAMNYHSFVAQAMEMGMPVPKDRIWFYRARTCIAGPFDDVWLPRDATDLDYEGELALVIGRRCRHVSVAGARTVVAGFIIANDLTLRNRATKSIVMGKSFDTHTPLGPWLGSTDELQNPHALRLQTWVNGDLRQDSTTADMIADCYELIAEISSACTLNPGDLILTGTPGGSGIFHRPPVSLCAGDVVSTAIDGLGATRNRVIDEPAPPAGAGDHAVASWTDQIR